MTASIAGIVFSALVMSVWTFQAIYVVARWLRRRWRSETSDPLA
jgi:hypothetical protein